VVEWVERFGGCWGVSGFLRLRLSHEAARAFAQDDRLVGEWAGSRFLPFGKLRVGMTERRATATARSRFLPFGKLRVGMTERKARATVRDEKQGQRAERGLLNLFDSKRVRQRLIY